MTSIKQLLNSTGYDFAHYAWSKQSNAIHKDHGVWAEDGSNDLRADNVHCEHAIEGTIDYFTRDDSGTPKATIEAAIDNGEVAWYLNSVQFEEDTGFIHYEWVYQIG